MAPVTRVEDQSTVLEMQGHRLVEETDVPPAQVRVLPRLLSFHRLGGPRGHDPGERTGWVGEIVERVQPTVMHEERRE